MTATQPNDLDNEANEDMDIHTVSAKRPVREDSSKEDPASPLPAKTAAIDSSASWQSGTLVPKGGGWGVEVGWSTKDLCLPCQRSSA